MKKFIIKARVTEINDMTIEVDALDKKTAEQFVLGGGFEEDDITDKLYVETTDTKIHSIEEVR